MKPNIQYVAAQDKDLEAVTQLLSTCHLPYQDLLLPLKYFVLAKSAGNLLGCVGLELYGRYGLLRSLAVLEHYRNAKIGNTLVNHILELAQANGISELYLLTNSAQGYFERQGFRVKDREFVPLEVKMSQQFSILCPSTAICMCKSI